MFRLFERLFYSLLKIDLLRKIFKYAYFKVTKYEQNRLCLSISPNRQVLGGLFKGLIYPDFVSTGSVLLPKIIGCYEDELKFVFNEVVNKSYEYVIDVGCAEGYYAIGMALVGNSKKVIAFDNNKYARKLCKEMSYINNVQDKVFIYDSCTSKELINLVANKKCLIICDIEGSESMLFTNEVISACSLSDVIIELHDFHLKGLSRKITSKFSETHAVDIIDSVYAKPVARYLKSSQISEYSIMDIDLNERPIKMAWMYAKSKINL